MYVLNPISENRDFDLSDQIVRKNMYIIVGFILCQAGNVPMRFYNLDTARATSDNLGRYIDLVNCWDLPRPAFYNKAN